MEEQIKERFANSAKYLLTKEELVKIGLNEFKRRVFGFCRIREVKTLEELAGILTDLRVVNNPDNGKQLIRELYGQDIDYGNKTLRFKAVYDKAGREACQITRAIGLDYWF